MPVSQIRQVLTQYLLVMEVLEAASQAVAVAEVSVPFRKFLS